MWYFQDTVMNGSASFLIICFVSLMGSESRGQGVAILKEQVFHQDSTATALAYSEIIDSHGPFLRISNGHSGLNVLRSKLVDRIEVPSEIPPSIEKEEDVAPLRKAVVELGIFCKRYPKSEPLLEATISTLEAHIGRFDDGLIHFERAWIPRERKVAILEQRRVEAQAERRRVIERFIYEAAQRDKGLVLFDGKWMTEDERKAIPPTSPTELSECIAPLFNGDLVGARFSLENLRSLAAKQTGVPKVRTQRLAALVKNLFQAETLYVNQKIAGHALTQRAAMLDENAERWLRPNYFGTVNKDAAAESKREAAELRRGWEESMESRRGELLGQLRETDRVVEDFHRLGEFRVVAILDRAARTVAARHFTEKEFKPAVSKEILDDIYAALRESVMSAE